MARRANPRKINAGKVHPMRLIRSSPRQGVVAASGGAAVARAPRSTSGVGEGGPIPLRRGHTERMCTARSSASRACARRARLV